MTTADAKNDQQPGPFRLPDPPEREADEATQFDQLSKTGNAHYLIRHFGNLRNHPGGSRPMDGCVPEH